ncbi:hypothetical protein SDC9_90920 [bioreactor metagenome]|uniref:Uncharacterized protein n=1 Tax=bioreactor metagenome TaxID=1076179 RepID=A0A644ZTQ3_9ZZZZ
MQARAEARNLQSHVDLTVLDIHSFVDHHDSAFQMVVEKNVVRTIENSL